MSKNELLSEHFSGFHLTVGMLYKNTNTCFITAIKNSYCHLSNSPVLWPSAFKLMCETYNMGKGVFLEIHGATILKQDTDNTFSNQPSALSVLSLLLLCLCV